MSYRPITDMWFLARARLLGGVKYYGAYPGGFPERARALIGCPIDAPMLHVCGGMARLYPYRGGFGQWDRTLDLDPNCSPDFLQDARDPFPKGFEGTHVTHAWGGILIDPPYSELEATKYAPGAAKYPTPLTLLRNALGVLPVGGKVGIIHYQLPQCPKKLNAKFVALAGVCVGFGNRIRAFTVFEKLAPRAEMTDSNGR